MDTRTSRAARFSRESPPRRPHDAHLSCVWGCAEFETRRNEWSQMPAAVQVSAAERVVFDQDVFAHLGQIALGIGNNADAHATGVGLGARSIDSQTQRVHRPGGRRHPGRRHQPGCAPSVQPGDGQPRRDHHQQSHREREPGLPGQQRDPQHVCRGRADPAQRDFGCALRWHRHRLGLGCQRCRR